MRSGAAGKPVSRTVVRCQECGKLCARTSGGRGADGTFFGPRRHPGCWGHLSDHDSGFVFTLPADLPRGEWEAFIEAEVKAGRQGVKILSGT